MYVIESYQDFTWVYKVVDEGLNKDGYIFTWDRIASATWHGLLYPHDWNVLTDDEFFLEMI